MEKTLEQAIMEMEHAYRNVARNRPLYNQSVAYLEFAEAKEFDLKMFKSLVAHLGHNTNIKNVVTYLIGVGVDSRFITMVQNPFKYFQMTEKLKILMMFGY